MQKTQTKSKPFYVTTRTVIERRYEVRAPSARAALLPLETLVSNWPSTTLSADTQIVRVVQKRRRFYAGKLIRRVK